MRVAAFGLNVIEKISNNRNKCSLNSVTGAINTKINRAMMIRNSQMKSDSYNSWFRIQEVQRITVPRTTLSYNNLLRIRIKMRVRFRISTTRVLPRIILRVSNRISNYFTSSHSNSNNSSRSFNKALQGVVPRRLINGNRYRLITEDCSSSNSNSKRS